MDKHKDFYFLEMNTRLQVEHPITEEITGIDLVQEQIQVAAGYPLSFKQSDIKIHGHAFEYRVYAEDPSRKFLPSIGFLKKYKEPREHPHIRIDTGVEEGSEISMHYDPMISKLITWGENRPAAMNLLATALDEYVIRGVNHNVGFGRSILRNQDFSYGNYTTAFIPTYYPTGFKGDPLYDYDHKTLAVAAHYMKNLYVGYTRPEARKDIWYVSIKKDSKDVDFKVEKKGTIFEFTEMESGATDTYEASDFDYEYGSILRFNMEENKEIVQFMNA